jgi:hypothetical protein
MPHSSLVLGSALVLLLLPVAGCGGADDGEDGDDAASDSGTDRGDSSADDGGECSPSSSVPAGDPDGPYGPCQELADCAMDANTCNTTCAGVCSPGCLANDDCPAVDGFTVTCRPSVSGSDPTGDCIITCSTSADCPGGMACDNLGYCHWAS